MPEGITAPGPGIRWHYRQIINWFGPCLMWLGGGWHVTGRDNVPDEGAAVICPNHISYLDPPLMGIAVQKRRCCYMGLAALFKVPLVGWFIRISYSYPVDRDEGGRAALRIASTMLDAGELLVMFPEGTRTVDGELLPGQLGAAFAASKAKVPIIPAAIWGADTVLPRHSKRLYRCPVYVRFGAPMHVPEPADGRRLSREELQAVTEDLMGRIGELQRQLRAEVPEKWRRKAARVRARTQGRAGEE